jgi:hypothetical protein
MDEFLNGWGAAPMQVNPPACDARYIPITKKKDVDVRTNARTCDCDRWGHPCPNRVEPNSLPQLALPISLPAKQLI